MHDHGGVALVALEHPAAAPAATGYVGRETSPVEKQQGLAAVIERPLQRLLEDRPQQHRLTRWKMASLLGHVQQSNGWDRESRCSFKHLVQLVDATQSGIGP